MNRRLWLLMGLSACSRSPELAGTGLDTAVCEPQSCEALEAECGTIDDGCGRTVNCGGCAPGTECDLNEPNRCGLLSCPPPTCERLSASCGSPVDACGQRVSCGSCQSDETCNEQFQCVYHSLDWDFHVIASGEGAGAKLAGVRDSTGAFHLAFQTGTGPTHLQYAVGDRDRWVIEDVDLRDESGRAVDVALDASGSPHLFGRLVNSLFRWERVAGRWESERVQPLSGTQVSAFYGLDGYARICDTPYNNALGQWLRYTYYFDGGMYQQNVDLSAGSATSAAKSCELRVDSAGTVWIAYVDDSAEEIRVASLSAASGSDWVIERVSDRSSGLSLDLQLKGDGSPVVFYQDRNRHLVLQERGSGGWTYEIVRQLEMDYAAYEALWIDPMGQLHLLYSFMDTSGVRSLYYQSGWGPFFAPEELVRGVGVSRGAFAVNEDNKPVLVYYDVASDELVWAGRR